MNLPSIFTVLFATPQRNASRSSWQCARARRLQGCSSRGSGLDASAAGNPRASHGVHGKLADRDLRERPAPTSIKAARAAIDRPTLTARRPGTCLPR